MGARLAVSLVEGEPHNNALEQTVGAARRLEAPPAAQRERSPDTGAEVEKAMRSSAMALLLVAVLAAGAWPKPTPRPSACEAAAIKLFGQKPPALGMDAPEPNKTLDIPFEFPRRKLPPKGKNIFAWGGEVLIGPKGTVRDVFVTRDFSFEPAWPEFSAAVPTAMRKWEYTPTIVNGVAAPVCLPVSVNVHW